MKKDIADKWIAALRNPNAKQGTGRLESVDGSQCCLGVLCRVVGITPKLSATGEYYQFDGSGTLLPQSAVNFSGIRSANGAYEGGSLLADNDRGKTFPEIANIIEQHWEVL